MSRIVVSGGVYKGDGTERVTIRNRKKDKYYDVLPVKEYTADEIKQLRQSFGLSQEMFALALGVSDKTVAAWESGRNTPIGTASRIMSLIEEDGSIMEKFIMQRQ